MEGAFPTYFSATYLMLANQPLTLDNPLTLFIRDAFRFISAFITPISQSTPHVYLSALPFTPEESHVARKLESLLSSFDNPTILRDLLSPSRQAGLGRNHNKSFIYT